MQKGVKVFPLRLSEDVHGEIKENAEKHSKSMHQFVLDAVEKEIKNRHDNEELFKLLKRTYSFIKGGPAPELEKELLDWLLNSK